MVSRQKQTTRWLNMISHQSSYWGMSTLAVPILLKLTLTSDGASDTESPHKLVHKIVLLCSCGVISLQYLGHWMERACSPLSRLHGSSLRLPEQSIAKPRFLRSCFQSCRWRTLMLHAFPRPSSLDSSQIQFLSWSFWEICPQRSLCFVYPGETDATTALDRTFQRHRPSEQIWTCPSSLPTLCYSPSPRAVFRWSVRWTKITVTVLGRWLFWCPFWFQIPWMRPLIRSSKAFLRKRTLWNGQLPVQ